MSYGGGHHGHGSMGIFALVAAVAFAFGMRTAKIVVGVTLVAAVVFFSYVMIRVIMGTV